MNYAVLLTQTDELAKVVECATDDVLQECYRLIDCDTVQLVPTWNGRLPRGYEALCDENDFGKTTFINPLASWLYGADDHGSAIHGNVILLKVVDTEDGDNLAFMAEDEAKALAEEMNKDFDVKYDMVVFKVLVRGMKE